MSCPHPHAFSHHWISITLFLTLCLLFFTFHSTIPPVTNPTHTLQKYPFLPFPDLSCHPQLHHSHNTTFLFYTSFSLSSHISLPSLSNLHFPLSATTIAASFLHYLLPRPSLSLLTLPLQLLIVTPSTLPQRPSTAASRLPNVTSPPETLASCFVRLFYCVLDLVMALGRDLVAWLRVWSDVAEGLVWSGCPSGLKGLLAALPVFTPYHLT